LAAIIQVPATLPVTVVPLIEQIVLVVLVNLTDKLDVAVADTAPVPPTTMLGTVPKVMVWLVFTGSETVIC
jgi:hypothetical protein